MPSQSVWSLDSLERQMKCQSWDCMSAFFHGGRQNLTFWWHASLMQAWNEALFRSSNYVSERSHRCGPWIFPSLFSIWIEDYTHSLNVSAHMMPWRTSSCMNTFSWGHSMSASFSKAGFVANRLRNKSIMVSTWSMRVTCLRVTCMSVSSLHAISMRVTRIWVMCMWLSSNLVVNRVVLRSPVSWVMMVIRINKTPWCHRKHVHKFDFDLAETLTNVDNLRAINCNACLALHTEWWPWWVWWP